MRIYIDIETIPDQRDGALEAARSRVRAPANYKDPEKIGAYIDEHAETAYRETALDGTYGQIVCVCYAVDDSPVATFMGSEPDILHRAWADVSKAARGQTPTFIGHNVQFDLAYLYHRSVVNRVRPSVHIPHTAAPWTGAYVDTQYLWRGAKGYIKLTELCAALGIEADDEIDGSQVWDRYQAGDMDSILEHCVADVERVRQIYKRLRFED